MEAVRRGLPCRVTAFIEEALRWLPDSEVRIGEAPDRVAEPADAPRLRGARVLLAEDNADTRAYVRRLLGTYYVVDTVADGEPALEAIRQRRPDLLLTDVMMPRLDGFGLLRAIRDDPNLRDLPVVMLSARAGEEARVEGLNAGADDYLVKPFAACELLARVESNLKLARVRQEATAELQASECRFRTIVNQTITGVVQADSTGRMTLVNRRWCEMLGYTEAELLHMTIADVTDPDDLTPTLEAARRLAAGEPDCEIEQRYRRKDGSILWASSSVNALRSTTGEYLGLVAVVLDISDRKRAEAALQEEAGALAALDRIGRSLSAELNLERLVQTVTDAATEISGAAFGSFFYNAVDERGEIYMLYTLSGAPRDAFADSPMPRNTTLFAQTFAGTGVVRLDDVREDPRFGDNPPYYGMPPGHLPVCSYLAVPVISRSGEALGGLFFGHPEPGVFTERAEHIVTGIAAQAAIAIDNARLYQAAQREITERKQVQADLTALKDRLGTELVDMERLHALSTRLMQQDNLAAVLHEVLVVAAGLLHVDKGSVQIYDAQNNTLKLVSAIGFDQDFLNQFNVVDADGATTCAAALRRGRRVIVENLATDLEFAELARAIIPHGILAAQSTPFFGSDGRLCGMLTTYFGQPHRPSERELRLLELYAQQAARQIERKQAEKALRESEQRFAAIFNQAAGGIARVDLSGRFTMVNDCYCRIVGRAREQLLTMRLQNLTHPDDLLSSQAHFQAAVEHGRPFTIEKRYLHPDGSAVWVSKDMAAVRNPHGKPVGVIVICQDITARRQTEQLLVEQKKLLEMIALGAPLDDCLSALCAAMPKLNPHTRAGILLADAQHQTFLRSIAPDLFPSFDQELKGTPINDDHLSAYGEAVFRARPISCSDIANDGAWSQQWRDLCLANHILACHSAPVLGVDGLSLGAFILCFDERRAPNEWERRLTEFGTHIASIALERDRASQTLRESEARYRALSEALERRVAVRTTELQHQATRLRHLAGELTSAEQRERKRLAAILHDGLQQLLVAAKMRLGQVRGRVRDAAALSAIEGVTDLLSQAVDSSRNLTQQLRPPVLYEGGLMPALRWLASELPKLHDLHVAIDTEETELSLSDDIKALLFESARELLFNVVKHAGVKEAAVHVQQDGQRLQIAVEDAGIGFDVDAVAREQDPQQRGIGLFSIRERLAALGGDMVMESIPNGGTRIRLIVPLAQTGGGAAAAQSTLSPVAAGTQTPGPLAADRQARVLVVDDHAIVREGISNVLSGDERLVVIGEAADGVEAIEAVERHQPDVVLIDVNMPRMNGVEATREISRRWPAVRIVALSVQDDAATARTMLRAGAAAFVSKSDDAGQMIDAVLAPSAKD